MERAVACERIKLLQPNLFRVHVIRSRLTIQSGGHGPWPDDPKGAEAAGHQRQIPARRRRSIKAALRRCSLVRSL
ncbi:hypothetical protein D3C86_806640 [compost metagenome]